MLQRVAEKTREADADFFAEWLNNLLEKKNQGMLPHININP